MRQMRCTKTKSVINVTSHFILKNGWEYYVTDNIFDKENQIVTCLVMGFEIELGDVYLPEVLPYKISQTTELNEVMPAQGWEWL